MRGTRDLPRDGTVVDALLHVAVSLSAPPSLVAPSISWLNDRSCIPAYEALGASSMRENAGSSLLRESKLLAL